MNAKAATIAAPATTAAPMALRDLFGRFGRGDRWFLARRSGGFR
jgi:hypothetical protein